MFVERSYATDNNSLDCLDFACGFTGFLMKSYGSSKRKRSRYIDFWESTVYHKLAENGNIGIAGFTTWKQTINVMSVSIQVRISVT